MSRYIDAELIEYHPQQFFGPPYGGNKYDIVTRSEVEKIPNADVQEVVLCTNCKFWDREHISCEGLARCNTGESGIRYRSQNDFCSRGAIMDNGEDVEYKIMETNKQQAINEIYEHMKAIREIANDYCSDDDRYFILAIHSDGQISFRNTYWELPEDKQIEFWEADKC